MVNPAPSPPDPLRPTEAEIGAALASATYAGAIRAAYALALPRLVKAVCEVCKDEVPTGEMLHGRRWTEGELLAAAAKLTGER